MACGSADRSPPTGRRPDGPVLATERRLASEAEYGQIAKCHYPELERLREVELRALARWLREARDRARG